MSAKISFLLARLLRLGAGSKSEPARKESDPERMRAFVNFDETLANAARQQLRLELRRSPMTSGHVHVETRSKNETENAHRHKDDKQIIGLAK